MAIVSIVTMLGWYFGVMSPAQPPLPAPVAPALGAAAQSTRNAELQSLLARNKDLRAEVEGLETALSVSNPAGGGGAAQEGALPPPPPPLGVRPLYLTPATAHAEFCALIPATSKKAYTKYLEMMAETIGRNVHVNSWLLFNGDDGSEPSVEDTYKLCDELTKSGPRMRCHIANVTNCPVGRKCAAATIFASAKAIGHDLLNKCDWVIKLDPDCIFIPNAALEFVRDLSPTKKVFYGTFSSKLVYSGSDHLWLRTQMPKGNWMVSIATWKRMQIVAGMTPCTPNGEYAGTDEAAALLCAWVSYGADCVTNWRDYVRIGPAKETEQNLAEHVDRVKNVLGSKACIMLIHKYKMDEFVPIYHELQALNHQDRECGPAGLTLQDTEDYDYNRAAVFGFKFPNKTIIDADFDCARQNDLPEELNFRRPPQWVIDEGKQYTGPTGSAASHFKERKFHKMDKGQPGGAQA